MAIIVEEERKSSPWLIVIITVFLIVFLVFGVYHLFFKPVPGEQEVVVSPELQSISRVSKITLDISSVIDSPVYKSLLKQVSDPSLGVFGRANPFAPF